MTRLQESKNQFTREAYNIALNLPAQARARAQKAKAAGINPIPNPVMMNTSMTETGDNALAAAAQAQRRRIASEQAAKARSALAAAAQAQRKRIAATTTTDADMSTPLRMPVGVQKSMVGARKLVSTPLRMPVGVQKSMVGTGKLVSDIGGGRSATTTVSTGVQPTNQPTNVIIDEDASASALASTSNIDSGDATGVVTNNVVGGGAGKLVSNIGKTAGGALNSSYTGISKVGKYGSNTINTILSEENRHIFIHVMLAINFLFTFLLYTNIVSISGWFTETAIAQHPGSNKKYIQWALFWIEMVMLLCFVPYLVVDLKSGEFNLPLSYILVNSLIMIILLSVVHYYTFKKENSTLVASAFPYKNKTYFMPYYGAFISVLVFNIIIFISAFYQQFFNQS
jgi:hypothetical protein